MRSLVVRINPLVQLAFGLFSLLGSFWIQSLPVALITLGVYVVAAVIFLPGWRYPLVCLAFALFAASTIVYSTWRLGGHDLEVAATAGLRIVVLALPGSVMAGYVDPSRFADYLAQSLRFPARLIAAFAAALQRFTGFGIAWQQLERARWVRGFGPSRSPVATARYVANLSFALLVHALRGASVSAIAMDARGFATAHDRTWAEPAPWTRLDQAGLLVAAMLGAVPIVVHLLP